MRPLTLAAGVLAFASAAFTAAIDNQNNLVQRVSRDGIFLFVFMPTRVQYLHPTLPLLCYSKKVFEMFPALGCVP